MTEKNITICGKECRVRYCAATETAFEKMAGKPISEINLQSQDDILKIGVAAIIAAYQRKDEEPPVSTEDLLFEATPKDIIGLVTAVFELRNAWYEIPAVAATEQPHDGEEPKNV